MALKKPIITVACFFLLLVACSPKPNERVDLRTQYVNLLLTPVDNFEATYASARYSELGKELGGITTKIKVQNTILTYYERISHSSDENVCTQKYTSGNSWDNCQCVPSKEGFRHDPCQIYGNIDLLDYDTYEKERQVELLQKKERIGSVAVASFETAEGSTCYVVTDIRDTDIEAAKVTISRFRGFILPNGKYSSMRTYCFATNGVYLFDFEVSELEDTWLDSEKSVSILDGEISAEYTLNNEIKNKVLQLRDEQTKNNK